MNKFMSRTLTLAAAFTIAASPFAAAANAEPYQSYCPNHTEAKWHSDGSNTWYTCERKVEPHR